MTSPPEDANRKNLFRHLFDGGSRETPTEVRNILLIVATLIAAVTFQAGVSPPGGVWQEDVSKGLMAGKAGQAIFASNKAAFYVFLICNSLALSSSILLIIILTYGFPFYFEVLVATISMVVTYGAAIFAVTPGEVKFRYVLSTAAAPFIIRTVIYVIFRLKSTKSYFRTGN